MKWIFEKFKGDMAVYTICPKCGFHHSPSRTDANIEITITNQYKYCPMCGEYLHTGGEGVDVIWNQRHISKLFEEKNK